MQSRAANEFDALPEGSALAEVVRASALDRQKMRACLEI